MTSGDLFPISYGKADSYELQFRLRIFYQFLRELPLSLPPRNLLSNVPRRTYQMGRVP